jgi:hypothetical protein
MSWPPRNATAVKTVKARHASQQQQTTNNKPQQQATTTPTVKNVLVPRLSTTPIS